MRFVVLLLAVLLVAPQFSGAPKPLEQHSSCNPAVEIC